MEYKKPERKHETKHCYKCRRNYYPSCVRECPHPAVRKVYGETICIYCCRGCKYKVTYEGYGGLGCGYVEYNKEDRG